MKERTVQIIIHALIWSAFLVLLLLFMPFYDLRLQQRPLLFLGMYVFLIAYYYFNSGFLVPRFLAENQVVKFVGITSGILVFYLYISNQFDWMQPAGLLPQQAVDGVAPGRLQPSPFPSAMPDPMSRESLFPWKHRLRFPAGSALTFLLVFIVSTGTKIISLWFESERKKNLAEREKSIAELNALKSQINPHFLFNTLNSIYYLAGKKSDITPDAILKLSDLMRFVLSETQSETISLQMEVESIRQYIDLQKLRLTPKTEVVFEVTGDTGEIRIAPLLLLPFVENAFKYGVSSHQETRISLFLSVSNGRLTFLVKNNKVKTPLEGKSTGTGLSNLKQRLLLSYPDKHALKIQETDLVYVAELKIVLT